MDRLAQDMDGVTRRVVTDDSGVEPSPAAADTGGDLLRAANVTA